MFCFPSFALGSSEFFIFIFHTWFSKKLIVNGVFLSLCVSLFCVCVFIMRCVKFRLCKTNRVGEDSCCRGGIVHIPGGCSCVRGIRSNRPTALWRFRVSTSNSLNGRSRPHSHTSIPYIYHTYAQQDIRVCEDDLLKPPKRQSKNSTALSLLRVSI